MTEQGQEKESFSIQKRVKSFGHALRGLKILLGEHNAWIELAVAALLVGLGLRYGISAGEWAVLIGSLATLLALEAVNTALEIDMDLTSPDYHPSARDVKDIAATAVLIAAAGTVAVALFIFLPKLW